MPFAVAATAGRCGLTPLPPKFNPLPQATYSTPSESHRRARWSFNRTQRDSFTAYLHLFVEFNNLYCLLDRFGPGEQGKIRVTLGRRGSEATNLTRCCGLATLHGAEQPVPRGQGHRITDQFTLKVAYRLLLPLVEELIPHPGCMVQDVLHGSLIRFPRMESGSTPHNCALSRIAGHMWYIGR